MLADEPPICPRCAGDLRMCRDQDAACMHCDACDWAGDPGRPRGGAPPASRSAAGTRPPPIALTEAQAREVGRLLAQHLIDHPPAEGYRLRLSADHAIAWLTGDQAVRMHLVRRAQRAAVKRQRSVTLIDPVSNAPIYYVTPEAAADALAAAHDPNRGATP